MKSKIPNEFHLNDICRSGPESSKEGNLSEPANSSDSNTREGNTITLEGKLLEHIRKFPNRGQDNPDDTERNRRARVERKNSREHSRTKDRGEKSLWLSRRREVFLNSRNFGFVLVFFSVASKIIFKNSCYPTTT